MFPLGDNVDSGIDLAGVDRHQSADHQPAQASSPIDRSTRVVTDTIHADFQSGTVSRKDRLNPSNDRDQSGAHFVD